MVFVWLSKTETPATFLRISFLCLAAKNNRSCLSPSALPDLSRSLPLRDYTSSSAVKFCCWISSWNHCTLPQSAMIPRRDQGTKFHSTRHIWQRCHTLFRIALSEALSRILAIPAVVLFHDLLQGRSEERRESWTMKAETGSAQQQAVSSSYWTIRKGSCFPRAETEIAA